MYISYFNNNLKKNNNICFIINNKQPWYRKDNLTNLMLFDNIIIQGFENFLFISSILLFIRFFNSNRIINKLTNPLIDVSKKLIDFKVPFIQITYTTAMISYIYSVTYAYGFTQFPNKSLKVYK